ncbi:serpin B10-like [Hyposmocoma kahamanoa]|uniref:serpin B10-like n=1 Tax=Hyposmocoma kahamanoa TaxID=1477025 RepID=UPI000E6D9CCA|nr:serpin B10-like [Hyposmocoma kahamanoa]XP_026326289.1 serpin B10-like [Hyposmocoma kahamanoa]XP_026326290.1 serpin B10-like [Hyposmocoma kahamanoa]
MMELYAELNYAYVDNLRAHAVELPYDDGRYSMLIVVPQDREGLSTLIRDLPYVSIPQIVEHLETNDVTLIMPRFNVEYSDDLVTSLRNMRITSLFSSRANLTSFFDGDAPVINNIYHKVHLTVDEAGTVAAAATGALVIPLIQSGVQLRVDRPFIFFIRDNQHGFVLFEGKIEEPTAYVDKNGLSGPGAKKNSRIISNKSF